MPMVSCPACNADIEVAPEKAYFRSRFECSACGGRLEVINERPLRVEWSPGKGGMNWISSWMTKTSTEKP